MERSSLSERPTQPGRKLWPALPVALTALFVCSQVIFSAGCSTSHVVVGHPRPATDPSQVKLYATPPKKYEQIAIVSSDSNASFRFSAQGKMDAALDRAKRDAAKLGANGLLLQSIRDTRNETFGNPTTSSQSTITGHQVDSPANTPYYGPSGGTLVKTIRAVAIYVTEE
jgi:hypothetical protein